MEKKTAVRKPSIWVNIGCLRSSLLKVHCSGEDKGRRQNLSNGFQSSLFFTFRLAIQLFRKRVRTHTHTHTNMSTLTKHNKQKKLQSWTSVELLSKVVAVEYIHVCVCMCTSCVWEREIMCATCQYSNIKTQKLNLCGTPKQGGGGGIWASRQLCLSLASFPV